MHRSLMSVIVGASALACAPSLAHADPQESRRTVYVYDGYDTYYVPSPRRILRRVFGEPERHRRHRQPAPQPQPVYAPPAPCAVPLLPTQRAAALMQQLERYRCHPQTQLALLADWTRGYLVTLDQVLCLTGHVSASADRVEALVLLYPQLDGRCCLDYVGRTQHLVGHCDRDAFACRIAGLRPACAHGHASQSTHDAPQPAPTQHAHAVPAQPAPTRVVVVQRDGRRDGRRR